MKAGSLRHWIRIENPELIRNTVGEAVREWRLLSVVPAAVSQQVSPGGEKFEAQQVREIVSYRFQIRYCPGVSRESRVIWSDRVFDIQSVVNPGERCRELQLFTVESDAQCL